MLKCSAGLFEQKWRRYLSGERVWPNDMKLGEIYSRDGDRPDVVYKVIELFDLGMNEVWFFYERICFAGEE